MGGGLQHPPLSIVLENNCATGYEKNMNNHKEKTVGIIGGMGPEAKDKDK